MSAYVAVAKQLGLPTVFSLKPGRFVFSVTPVSRRLVAVLSEIGDIHLPGEGARSSSENNTK